MNQQVEKTLRRICEDSAADSAHDLAHSQRVLRNALKISEIEGGDQDVLIAAALLHDIGNYPKDHPKRSESSKRSAEMAIEILKKLDFTKDQIEKIQDAILCHSYTAALTPKTLEGNVFQDADRLDGLGMIGIARCFSFSGKKGRGFYHPEDPFYETSRALDEKTYAVDHFFEKLFKVPALMRTKTGQKLADQRASQMREFLERLKNEISDDGILS